LPRGRPGFGRAIPRSSTRMPSGSSVIWIGSSWSRATRMARGIARSAEALVNSAPSPPRPIWCRGERSRIASWSPPAVGDGPRARRRRLRVGPSIDARPSRRWRDP